MSETVTKLHNFNLDSFKKSQSAMIATSDSAYGARPGQSQWADRTRDYTEEQVKRIIESGSLIEQQRLSRNYFNKDGYYKQLILYYATLLKYAGLLIPNPTAGKNLSTSHIQKRYFQAMDYVDKIGLQTVLVEWAQKALTDGCYYGVISKADKNHFAVLSLPSAYCQTRFKDLSGNDLIEFDVSYFRTITDENDREAALAAYPKIVASAYKKWNKGKLANKWVVIPSDVGICFPMLDGRPFFLSVIPATIQYDEAVDTEREREKEEIRKILVQKIPHLNDGRLLFEPDEAEEMHRGAVGMVRKNTNTTVLTTYADVDSIASRGSTENGATNALEAMKQNIYSQAGVSGEIFAASGGNTTETSIKFDTAVMMYLANKFARFITNIVNENFANSNISFKYTILPITHQNEAKYIDSCYKLATSGYSLVLPALAQGLSQRDLVNLKDLENDVLKLGDKLIPPASSFTGGKQDDEESAKGGLTGEGGEEGGRPNKSEEEKADKTLENEGSIEKSKTQGGSE